MIENLQGIVLACVRHSDRASVLTVYTPTHSCLPLIVPAAGGVRSRTSAAVRMPLAAVEFSCRSSRLSTLMRPSSLSLRRPWTDIYFNPVKNALAIFLSDFLSRLLRDTPPDPALYSYIEGSLCLLDELRGSVANFHIVFLSSLTSLLGIAPDVSACTPGSIFDMRAGTYTRQPPMHPDILAGTEARLPLILSRLTFLSMRRLHLDRIQRRRLLEGILRYYSMHLPVGRVPSLSILAELFN